MDRSQRVYKQGMRESGEWGKHRGDRAAQSARYREKYPERVRAHSLLQYAVDIGKIRKPNHCEICLRGGRIEGHHEDYDRPLEVVWVCSWCHNVIHAERDE